MKVKKWLIPAALLVALSAIPAQAMARSWRDVDGVRLWDTRGRGMIAVLWGGRTYYTYGGNSTYPTSITVYPGEYPVPPEGPKSTAPAPSTPSTPQELPITTGPDLGGKG